MIRYKSLSTSLSSSSLLKNNNIINKLQIKRIIHGLTINIPKESYENERRVAITPVNVIKLKKAGANVNIEKNAGIGSGFSDDMYIKAGATIVNSDDIWKGEVIAKIRPPTLNEAELINHHTIISIIQPKQNEEIMKKLISQKATVLSLDSLLRTLSRGQAFDVLSSQANVAGYRAVIEAAHQLQRPFAGQMTAAGK